MFLTQFIFFNSDLSHHGLHFTGLKLKLKILVGLQVSSQANTFCVFYPVVKLFHYDPAAQVAT